MTRIQTFQIKDTTVDFMHNKGKLAYTFNYAGERYGNAVNLENKAVDTIVAATAQLAINAYETIDKLQNAN